MDNMESPYLSSESTVDLVISNDPLEPDTAADGGRPGAGTSQRVGLLTPLVGLFTVLLIGVISFTIASNHRADNGPKPSSPTPQTAYNLQVVAGQCQLVPDTNPYATPVGLNVRLGNQLLTSDLGSVSNGSPDSASPASTPSAEEEAARKAAEARMSQEMGGQKTYFVLFSEDGKYIYSESYSNRGQTSTNSFQMPTSNIRVWDATGKPLFSFKGNIIGFVPNSDRILALSAEGKPELLDVSGKPLLTLNVKAIAADLNNKTGQFVSTDLNQTAQIWSAEGNLLTTLDGKYQYIHYTEDSKYIETLSYDQEKLKQIQSGKLSSSDVYNRRLWTLDGKLIKDFDSSKVLGGSRDQRRYITKADDGTLAVWDGSFEDGATGSTLVATIKGAGAVQSAFFSPDDNYILTIADDNTARVWDSQGKALATIPMLKSDYDKFNLNHPQFTPDSQHIYSFAAGPMDKEFLWSVDGKLLLTFGGVLSPVNLDMFALHFSHAGGFILASSDDPVTRLDCLLNTDGKLIATLGSPLPTPTPMAGDEVMSGGSSVFWLTSDGSNPGFSVNGDRVLTIAGTEVKLWGTDGKLIATLAGHISNVELAQFSPDGKMILTKAQDEARLWDANGKLIAVLKLDDGSGKLGAGESNPQSSR